MSVDVHIVVVTSGAADTEGKEQQEHEDCDDKIFMTWLLYDYIVNTATVVSRHVFLYSELQ